MTKNMIDVSSNNHADGVPIDWGKVAQAKIGAVMIKATEGLSYTNPWLDKDAHGARAAGLEIGYYHFAHPSLGTPEEQAGFLQRQSANLPRNIGYALDLEVAEGHPWGFLHDWAISFLDALSIDVANKVLYTSASWADNLQVSENTNLWVADWGVKTPRRKCWAWQFGQHNVDGVPGSTDVSYLYL